MAGNTWRTAHTNYVSVHLTVVETEGMSCRILSWLAVFRFRVFRLVSENVETKAHRTVILMWLLNECRTWPLILRENRGRMCAGMGCWRQYLDVRGRNCQDAWGNRIIRSFVVWATNSRRYIKQLLRAGHEERMWEKKGSGETWIEKSACLTWV